MGPTHRHTRSRATRFNDRQRARLDGVREALAARGLDLPEWRVSEQEFTLAGGRGGCAALRGGSQEPGCRGDREPISGR